jgi:hypothetical protein
MAIDLKQYIKGILHYEVQIPYEEINSEIVEKLISDFPSDRNLLSVENIKKRYLDLVPESVRIEHAEGLVAGSENLKEPQAEISIPNQEEKPQIQENKAIQVPKNVPGKPIILPNAKVGEGYEIAIPLAENGLSGIQTLSISDLDEVGLQFEHESRKITGIPKLAGEFSFIIEYKHQAETENRPSLFRKLAIYINPDPRSLWIEQEPDPESLFPKSHTAHSELFYQGKSVLGASKRGRSHAKDAKFRDDHFEIMVDEASDWLAITVSDGAGSAKYSREGSKIFCQTVLAEIFFGEKRTHLEAVSRIIEEGGFESQEKEIKKELYYLIGNALWKSYKEVEEAAKLNAAVVKDFSCTFLISLVKRVQDAWIIIGFWVGDGGIGIYFEDKEPIILGNPDSGEFSGQTRFITMPEILNNSEEIFGRIKLARVADFKGLALMTDGISDAWFHTDSNLFKKDKWDELWLDIHKNQAEQAKLNSIELLEWLDFWVKGEYDDRTIVILN